MPGGSQGDGACLLLPCSPNVAQLLWQNGFQTASPQDGDSPRMLKEGK